MVNVLYQPAKHDEAQEFLPCRAAEIAPGTALLEPGEADTSWAGLSTVPVNSWEEEEEEDDDGFFDDDDEDFDDDEDLDDDFFDDDEEEDDVEEEFDDED